MASHVRRLKLYPEPDLGGGGYRAGGGPLPKDRPRPPTNQSPAKGGPTASHSTPLSLVDLGLGEP